MPIAHRRRVRCGLLACVALLVATVCGGAAAHAQDPTPKEKFHIYLLIGQSNMAGRGRMTAEDRRPREGILMLNADNQWVPAAHPLHTDKPTAGVGLGISFAETMARHNPGVTIGLIPCAVGGTPLSRWSKGGDLYEAAVARAKIAMEAGQLRGILWHQGEADSSSQKNAASYGERLAKMVADLREELGATDVPFVAGELGYFFIESPKRGPHTKVVNEHLKQISQNVPLSACASAEGLDHKGDEVHFSSEALVEFARRYAQLMHKLQTQGAADSK